MGRLKALKSGICVTMRGANPAAGPLYYIRPIGGFLWGNLDSIPTGWVPGCWKHDVHDSPCADDGFEILPHRVRQIGFILHDV